MKGFRQIAVGVVAVLLFFSAVAHGDTWTTKMLTNNAGTSQYPSIAVDGANIYVVWHDYTPGAPEIYFKKSDDGGTTWSITKRLTNNIGSSVYPSIAVDGANIYVVWQYAETPGNNEIYFKKSDDGGSTWSIAKRLTNNTWHSETPAIAVDGANIYVVWQDGTQLDPYYPEIFFKRSTDKGDTWTTKRLTNNAGSSVYPAIAVDGANIYAVWQDYTPGNPEIYFKKSVDGGTTWSITKRLTNNAGSSCDPAIAVDGANIYVVWWDYTPGNPEIYFKKSVDGGTTWSTNKRLTNDIGTSQYPSIAVDGDNIYVVWQDYVPWPAGPPEIFFKRSTDKGDTWRTKRLTNNAGESNFPAIAVDGANIYVVWHDYTPVNWEIYFKAGILF